MTQPPASRPTATGAIPGGTHASTRADAGADARADTPGGGSRRPTGDLAGTGEFGLIAAVTALLPQHAGVLVGPGDDAAVVAAPDSRVVVTTDLLVEGRHFRRDWSQPYDVGRKAAAQNLADVAAMGAAPVALLVGLGAPPDLPVEWAVALAEGLRDEAGPAGASVVGGDTVRADQVVIAVTALGDLQGRAPVLRSGARPGDLVAVCGRLGWAAAGLAVLSRGFRSPRVLVEAHRRPDVDYAAGVEAAELGATAMVDVSDGLLADLGHVARASGVAVDVDPGSLEVPVPLRDVSGALGADPLRWLLTGGDDHALAACFPAGTGLPARWRVVGRVAEGDGITVAGEEYEGGAGHDHFR
ncbi:MAG TPA: thiamine-phosphate kinase [Jiangellales bacterium]|nr:thiamine-phosphate kinase [Jiangellales bacterium]